MAIFGKKDAALPFVTQAVQVDTGKEAEVIRFMLRTLALAQLYAVSNLKPKNNAKVELDEGDGWIITDEGEMLFQLPPEMDVPIMESLAEENLNRLLGRNEYMDADAKAHGYESGRQRLIYEFTKGLHHTKEIFQSIYRVNAVPMDSLAFLRKTFAVPTELAPDISDPVFRSELKAAMEWETEEGGTKLPVVPLEKFMPGGYFESVLPGLFLSGEMERLLLAIWRKEKRLSQCKECQNIMVEQRKGQKFCSARCANRIAQRRKVRREAREARTCS